MENDEAIQWLQPNSRCGVAYDIAENIPSGGIANTGQGLRDILLRSLKSSNEKLKWNGSSHALGQPDKPSKTVGTPDHKGMRVFSLVSFHFPILEVSITKVIRLIFLLTLSQNNGSQKSSILYNIAKVCSNFYCALEIFLFFRK